MLYWIKYYIGQILSYYYDKRDEDAFKMPYSTREEYDACIAYINYNIDPDAREVILHHAHSYASYKADHCNSGKNKKLFTYYFTTSFYYSLYLYKIRIFFWNIYYFFN